MISPFKSKYEGSLDSTYVPQYALGAPTSPQTANQIAEATARLNAGVYGVDLAIINEQLFEQIPKQHFKEIDRLMKLTGAKATIHGPLVDLSGFSFGEGSAPRWDEENRRQTEKKVNYYLDMAHEADSKGNTPINFHINAGPIGETWEKVNAETLKKEYGVDPRKADDLDEIEKQSIRITKDPYTEKNNYEVKKLMYAMDQESGQLLPFRYEVKNFVDGPHLYTPDKQLMLQNESNWDKAKENIYNHQKQKAEIMDRVRVLMREGEPLEHGRQKGILSQEEENKLNNIRGNIQSWAGHIEEIDKHIHTGLNNLYHELDFIPKEYKNNVDELKENIQKEYEGYGRIQQDIIRKARRGQVSKGDEETFAKIKELEERSLQINLERVGQRVKNESEYIPFPQKFVPTTPFTKGKTSETVSNVVFESWKKYKDNTPIMLLENFFPEGNIGSAEDLKETIIESRNKLVNKLVKEKGLDKNKAEKVAESLIGVTWDVGHINFLRRQGYDEQKVLEETKKIAPYIKQVHITDNFGFNDAHLPPGMGNAPIKEEMEIIAREMRKKGLDFKKGSVIVEAGSFVGQFKENPHPYSLEYFESPLYTYKNMPYWKDIWETEGKYGLGYGQILPEQHFGMYGAGFSNLPVDLGGPISQDRSRFAGTPNT